IVGLTAIAGLFTYLRGRWAGLAAERIARRLRDRLHDHLHHLPCRYFDTADTGDLVQRCTSDVETFRMFLSTQLVEIGRGGDDGAATSAHARDRLADDAGLGGARSGDRRLLLLLLQGSAELVPGCGRGGSRHDEHAAGEPERNPSGAGVRA